MISVRMSLLIVLTLPFLAYAQLSEKLIQLNLNRDGRFVEYRAVVPASIETAFPERRASGGEREHLTFSRGPLFDSIVRRIELLSVSRYIDHKPQRIGPDSGEVQVISHPTFFSAAIYDGEIYVLYRGDRAGNVAVANRLIRKMGVSASNREEARQLAEFYLLLYSHSFKDPSKLIISQVEDIPEKQRKERPERVANLDAMIRPLQVSERDGRYQVKFFTWEYLPRGEVINWQIEISSGGGLDVTEHVVAMI